MSALPNQILLNRAVELHQGGRLAEAEEIYRQILASEPQNWEALHLLGLIAFAVDNFALAAELVEHAVAIEPRSVEAWANLSSIYVGADRLKDAEAAGRAVRMNPDLRLGQLNFATALALQGRLHEAAPIFETLANNSPDQKIVHNLSLAHLGLGHADKAVHWARYEMQYWPDSEDSYLDLSMALQAVASEPSLREAVEILHAALARWPDIASPHGGLSAALFSLGEYEESRRHSGISLKLDLENPTVRFNHAIQLLLAGDHTRGWEEYEWRMRRRDVTFPWRKLSQPKWEGQELARRTVLVCAEQGFGDSMQYSRFVPRLIERGAKVIIACEPELIELLRSVPGVSGVLNQDGPMPPFDYFLPLPSLPHAFGVTVDTIPAGPGLSAPRDIIDQWRKRLEAGEPSAGKRNLRVGLCWAGSAKPFRARTMPFSQLAPLGEIPGIIFHSLQIGAPGDEAAGAPAGPRVIDHRDELVDFAQSAALVANLDLVITIDSAVAHLAASIGKPTWIMLPLAADWRWRLYDGRCPWYPAARLFAQRKFGDWTPVVEEVAAALKAFAR